VVGVSWYEAVAFCHWLSAASGEKIALPTEQQWQRAAQGDDGRAFPWGNTWDAGKCNNNVDKKGIGRTTPVTAYPGGSSPFGVFDLSGNVWEWCLTSYAEESNDVNIEAEYRVLRGGSWNDDDIDVFRAPSRDRNYPNGRNGNWGFRCARS
jgi:formylglycine-generating enzyme required for sulfatase activity